MSTALAREPSGVGMIGQFLRFGVVGVANTAMCLAILWTLTDRFGVPVWLASGIGYAVSIAQSYLLNRFWTFGGKRGAGVPVGPQLLRFVLVNVVVGVIYSTLTSVLAPDLGVRLASFAALVPVVLLSFFAMRRFVFGAR
jgi:putative flippase GtrA